MDYYIGIDIGTTSVKAVAFSGEGDIIARESIAYPIQHPQPHFSEQNPDEILLAVVDSLHRLSVSLASHKARLVSFSAAMHSIMAVDHAGKPLSNLMIWADNRAGSIADTLKESAPGQQFYQKTGVPIHAMSPFCKLLWLKENNKPLFSTAHKFIGIKEYIYYHFFEKYIADYGIASATGLLNIHTLRWDDDILQYGGIAASQLSTLVSGTHKEYLQEGSSFFEDKRLQLVRDAAFIAGGSDGALANLGSHAVAANTMAITIGTSAAVRLVSNHIVTDSAARTFCYYLNDNSYIIGGASSNGGVVMQWLKDNLLQTEDDYNTLLEQAEKISPACDGLLFIPYLLGERAPVWNSHAKGVLFGLDINHTRGHLIRSAIEAIVYSVYSIGKILMEQREINELYVTGGFTQNPFWVQLLSDMFNCTVHISGAAEGSATGAVMIGLQALEIEQSWKPAISASYYPNNKLHVIYLRQFEKFERIYGTLKSEMDRQ